MILYLRLPFIISGWIEKYYLSIFVKKTFTMYSFKNDYSEGAHPQILNKLMETNLIQQAGYGLDEYTDEAKSVLKHKMGNQDASIFFVTGGTQANLLVISSLLKSHEAVISAETGHIYANETGAIEAKGHKVIPVKSENGKLNAINIEQILKKYQLGPHVVKPKLVYISNATELGTVYTKEELKSLYTICKANDLFLFIDGARLGHALMAKNGDLDLKDMSKYCDAFYIGGTKNGALIGEAIVFNKPSDCIDFDFILKQNGALLAKGRILGIQFLELFRENLYLDLANHANSMAEILSKAFAQHGYSSLVEGTTNQLFPILPNSLINTLSKDFEFYVWQQIDADHSAVRLITSWNTDVQKVQLFVDLLAKLH